MFKKVNPLQRLKTLSGDVIYTVMCIEVGAIVKTSYGTGPYKIIQVTGPCTCTKYTSALYDFKNPLASLPHYHFVCTEKNGIRKPVLNGYNKQNGKIKSVWCNDEIEVISFKAGHQFSLF